MKNGLLAWNVVLTIIAGYLLFIHLNKKTDKAVQGKASVRDSSGQSSFRIAYFEMDSIENNLDMVKAVKAEISKKDEEYNNGLSQIDWTYQKKVQEYQQKASTMTQADYEKAQTDLKQLEQSLKGRKQELDQQYQDFVMRRNLSVKKKIEDFLAKYNQNSKYSYIVAYEQGLFYYKDTAYNITNDLIHGLNVEYRSEKK
ncbi:MAG: OmpH family outer membrane protein [Chitinophagaceae bacterium]